MSLALSLICCPQPKSTPDKGLSTSQIYEAITDLVAGLLCITAGVLAFYQLSSSIDPFFAPLGTLNEYAIYSLIGLGLGLIALDAIIIMVKQNSTIQTLQKPPTRNIGIQSDSKAASPQKQTDEHRSFSSKKENKKNEYPVEHERVIKLQTQVRQLEKQLKTAESQVKFWHNIAKVHTKPKNTKSSQRRSSTTSIPPNIMNRIASRRGSV